MRILSKSDTEILTEFWLEDLPKGILDTVCQTPGITQAAILRLFVKNLPTSIEPEYICNRCLSSIYWFLYHGDIATSGNRRYVAVPPYAVLHRADGDEILLMLFGDPRLDQYVADSIGEFGSNLDIRMATWRWDNRSEDTATNVGLRRSISANSGQLKEIESHFLSLQIPIIQPHTLQVRLPSIEQLKSPPRAAFASVPPNWGSWDIYDAGLIKPIRWRSVSDWSALRAGILRWRPSDDQHGEANARFFLIDYGAKLFELSSTSARLWTLFFDLKENNSRQFWIYEKSLWIPLSLLPEAHEQWLQLVSQDRHRDGEFMKYYLQIEPEQVNNALTNTLGLHPVFSTPFNGTRR